MSNSESDSCNRRVRLIRSLNGRAKSCVTRTRTRTRMRAHATMQTAHHHCAPPMSNAHTRSLSACFYAKPLLSMLEHMLCVFFCCLYVCCVLFGVPLSLCVYTLASACAQLHKNRGCGGGGGGCGALTECVCVARCDKYRPSPQSGDISILIWSTVMRRLAPMRVHACMVLCTCANARARAWSTQVVRACTRVRCGSVVAHTTGRARAFVR